MANEGSTKATYEELEQRLFEHIRAGDDEAERLRAKFGIAPDGRDLEAQLNEKAAELARVRGLLQRIHGYFLWRVSPDSKGRHIVEDDVIRNVNKLCESGAESADIGKLDTADKEKAESALRNQFSCYFDRDPETPGTYSGVEVLNFARAVKEESGVEMRKVNSAPHSSMAEPFPYKGQVAGSSPVAATILNELVSAIVTYLVEMSADNLDVLDKAVDKSQAWLMAGSAETGGEKAAPELNMTRADDGRPQFLWFGGKYYTIEHSECMDALLKAIRSSGVEGAHEGTTADKSELLPTQLPKESPK